MQETRVTFEQGKKLKEAGFDLKCDTYLCIIDGSDVLMEHYAIDNYNLHNGIYSIPTLSHACMWIREVKGLHVAVGSICREEWYCEIHKTDNGDVAMFISNLNTHDLALSAGIDKALTLI